MAKKPKTFAEFCADPRLINEPISPAWAVTYKAFDGEPLQEEDLPVYRQMSGLETYEQIERRELVCVKGRRAAGTSTATKYLIYKIATGDYARFAPKGERLHVPIIAQTRDVAHLIMGYLTRFYTNSPLLGAGVADILASQIVLKAGFVVSVSTCSYRAPRGIAAPLALCDEVGVWRQNGSDVDHEVIRSLTPAMIQFPNRRLISLGTPWVKAGYLHDAFEHRFERRDRLVVHCPTTLMNPLIDPEELEKERLADPQNFQREFEGVWLDDVEQFLPDADIRAAIVVGRKELPPVSGKRYLGVVDASSLVGRDRFVFGVGHRDENIGAAVDLLRGWSRSPVPQVCDEVAALAKSYGIGGIFADQYGYAFLRELMSQRGIEVKQLPFSARSKPEIFIDLKLGLAQGQFALLDHADSLRELRALESTRLSGGNYRICGGRGQHDDYACVLAMLAHETKQKKSGKPWITAIDCSAPLPIKPGEVPLGPGDGGFSPSHQFGPERFWRKF